MNELDPNIILQGRPVQFANPMELASNALQIRNLGLQGQNQQITLEQNQRALKDQKTIADLYRANTQPDGSVNHAGVVQGLAQAGLGDKIPAYQQQVATASKDTTAASAADLELHQKKLGIVNNALASLVSKPDLNQNDVIGAINGLVNNGVVDPQTGAQMARQIPGRPEQLRPFLMQKGLETMDVQKQIEARLATAPKYNAQDQGGTINQGTIDPQTGIRTAGVNVAKTMTPDEKAKIDLAKSGALSPDAKQLMVERLLAGEKPSNVLGNLGRGQQGAADLRDVQNLLATQARQKGLSGAQITGILQDTAATGRTLTELGAREGKIAPRAQELDTFSDQALAASANVPRDNWKIINKIAMWGADQSNDPDLARLQTAIDGVINARAAAIGGGVVHVGDQKTGHALLAAAQSPEAFAAVIDQFKKEAQGALSAPSEVRKKLTENRAAAAPVTATNGTPVPADIAAILKKHGAK